MAPTMATHLALPAMHAVAQLSSHGNLLLGFLGLLGRAAGAAVVLPDTRPAAWPEMPDVESSSERYARRFAGSVGAWFLETQARALLDLLAPLPPGLRVLDVGGGHAQLAPVLVGAGHQVTVLGSTPECGARLLPWTRDGRCRFETGDLQQLPYEDASFDVAVSVRILGHLREPDRLVGELCRVARRSVVVDFASTRGLNALADRFFALKLLVEGNTRSFTSFSPAEVRQAFARHGFDVRESRAQYLLPMALLRWVGSARVGRALEAPGALLGLRRLFGSPLVVRADRRGPIRAGA
jgi:SAM-dependent methyltransferase